MATVPVQLNAAGRWLARLRVHLPLWYAAGIVAAIGIGADLTHPGKSGKLAIIVGCLPLAAMLALDEPFALFTAAVTLIAVYSEEGQDNTILPGAGYVYGAAPHSAVELMLYLLAGGFALRLAREGVGRAWPGFPAVGALMLGVAALVSAATHPGPYKPELGVLRDALLIFIAMLCGYWLATVRSPAELYRVFVLATVPMIPLGAYNFVTGAGAHAGSGGALSFYDATSVYVLGIGVLLVGFEVVDLGVWRVPYCLLGAGVMIVSLRRGAILSIALALVLTLLLTTWSAKSTRWAWAGFAVLAAVAVEAIAPGTLVNETGHLAAYLTGSHGKDWSVNYRNFERPNVWLSVKHAWLNGVGPDGTWTVWNSYNGTFVPLGQQYVHNNYLWVWLHYGLFGIISLVVFMAGTVLTLLSRLRQHVAITIIGSAIVGSAIMYATGSQLTTTVRWPAITGLLVGIACAQRRAETALRR